MQETTLKQPEISESALDMIITKILDGLKARPKEILVRRFGLDGREPQVLDKIGQDFGITRERVRQIERDSFKKLRQIDKGQEYQEIVDRAIEMLKQLGGFCEHRKLKESLKSPLAQKERNQLMFILNSCFELSYNKGSLSVRGFWYLKEQIKGEEVLEIHEFVVRQLKEQRVPYTFDDLLGYLGQSTWKKYFQDDKKEVRLEMILLLSRVLNKNILGEWGMKNWRLISERGTREKAFLVLRKYKKPLHFSQITKLINKHWEEKTALPQTVHNELIKDKRFVLVGRGMYGLRDWGFEEGTVKEIMINLLRTKELPLKREEIVSHVLAKKKVKKATVMVNLADRKIFQRIENGRFVLRG